jgi:hypothetical protein
MVVRDVALCRREETVDDRGTAGCVSFVGGFGDDVVNLMLHR